MVKARRAGASGTDGVDRFGLPGRIVVEPNDQWVQVRAPVGEPGVIECRRVGAKSIEATYVVREQGPLPVLPVSDVERGHEKIGNAGDPSVRPCEPVNESRRTILL